MALSSLFPAACRVPLLRGAIPPTFNFIEHLYRLLRLVKVLFLCLASYPSFFPFSPLLTNSRFHGTFVRDIMEMNILERKKVYVSFDNLCDKSLLLFLERKSIRKKGIKNIIITRDKN